MPLWTPNQRDTFRVDNWGTNPSATPGTSVVPGASDVEGSWTQLLSALAQEASAFHVRVSDGATATTSKPHLLDIGIDLSGGTSYSTLIENIVCGAAGAIGTLGQAHEFFFPLRIPAGASVAARVQGGNATAGTVRIAIRCYGQPSAPWAMPVGQFAETFGSISLSSGVIFTPGNGSDGSWSQLGANLTRPLWWWQLCYQITGGTITAEYTYIELAFGDATNKHVISRHMHAGDTSERIGTVFKENLIWAASYCPVPAGAGIYIRGRCNNAPDTGYNAVAIGIGG